MLIKGSKLALTVWGGGSCLSGWLELNSRTILWGDGFTNASHVQFYLLSAALCCPAPVEYLSLANKLYQTMLFRGVNLWKYQYTKLTMSFT